MTIEEDVALLNAADLFYLTDADDDPAAEKKYTLNMNDVWFWASGWGEDVPKDAFPEVARLFRSYGWPGVLYWVSCQHDNMRSEFHDNNRFIDFVKHEEQLRKDVPDSNKRAYKKIKYTLGNE